MSEQVLTSQVQLYILLKSHKQKVDMFLSEPQISTILLVDEPIQI